MIHEELAKIGITLATWMTFSPLLRLDWQNTFRLVDERKLCKPNNFTESRYSNRRTCTNNILWHLWVIWDCPRHIPTLDTLDTYGLSMAASDNPHTELKYVIPKASFPSYTWCTAFNCCRLRVNFAMTFQLAKVRWKLPWNRCIRNNYANHFQMYVDYTGSLGFSGDGHTCANSGYLAFFLMSGLGMSLRELVPDYRQCSFLEERPIFLGISTANHSDRWGHMVAVVASCTNVCIC